MLDELEAKQGNAGFLISGMGGAGKTVLAMRLIERVKSRYSDSQFYLDLAGTSSRPLSLRAIMVHVITSLRPDIEIPKQHKELEGLYRSVLNNQHAILFFDNAKDGTQIDSLLPGRDSLVIATSRNHFSLPGFATIKLDPMLPQDAHAFLRKIAPRADDSVEELAHACGYLPLALRLAGSVLATRRDLRSSDYLQQLKVSEKRLKLVEGSLSLSYNLLDAKTRIVWRMLAVFREAFDVPAAAAVWGMELADAHDKLGEILSYSMLEWDEQMQRYRLHDLAQIFAAKSVEPSEHVSARDRHAVHYARVARAAYDVIVSRRAESVSRGFELLYSDWVNISVGQAWAASNIDRNEEAARLCREYVRSAPFFHLIKNDPSELARWLEAAVRGDRRLKDKSAEAFDLGMLGSIQVILGDLPEAIKSHHKALSVSRNVGDRQKEADELHQLMELHEGQHEIGKAINYGESALVIHRDLNDWRKEADALASLAGLYKESDDHARSIDYYQSAVEINHHLGRHLEEAENLFTLGRAYGDISRAISSLEQAVTLFHKLGETAEEARTLLSMAERYRVAKDVARSVEISQNAAKLFNQLGHREEAATALMLAGESYSDSSQSEHAIGYAERSLEIAREIGAQDLIILNLQILVTVHGQFGRVDLAMNETESSIRHLKAQLAAAKEIRALNQPLPEYMEADALLTLGLISLKEKKLLEAMGFLTEGLNIARSTDSKQEEAKILDSLGLVFYSMGDRQRAIESARASLVIFETLGDPHASMPRKHLASFQSA